MKKLLPVLVLILIIFVASIFYFQNKGTKIISPLGKIPLEKPLDKYTFEALKKKNFEASEIEIGKILKQGDNFTSYIYYFKDGGKRVSGLMNLPIKEGTYPVIVMFRGYVDKKAYTTGEGTRRSAEVFAENGFITLAPDFLSYGESDKKSDRPFEDRFQTYTTAITLLESIKNLNKSLEGEDVKADTQKVGIWGHSNGGHIALSILEITGENYPTVLWAPVSKPFPYSILYFTDDFDDKGKALRKVLAGFENNYDVEKYSTDNFYKWINAPIQLHQGVEDESVPLVWSNQLYNKLTKLDKDITYYTYPGENHNFQNGSWPFAIQRSINFYKGYFDK